MGLWLSTLVLLTGIAGEPLPGVVVLSTDAEAHSSSFVESMQIQLTGLASVTLGPPDETASTQARAERARLYLSATGASIAVWKERRVVAKTGAVQTVVLAVTRDRARRPIEVARIVGLGPDEADRILALKVGELLHQVLSASKSEQELALELERREQKPAEEAPQPPPPAKKAPAQERPSFRAFAQAGLGLRTDSSASGQQVSFSGALGGSFEPRALRLELGLGVRRLTDLEFRTAFGSLTVSELDLGAELRGLVRLRPLAFGVHLGGAASFVGAAATSVDGRRGGAQKVGLGWSAGPELRLELARHLEMRTEVAVEGAIYEQAFAIEGREVPDGSPVRLSGELQLMLWIP